MLKYRPHSKIPATLRQLSILVTVVMFAAATFTLGLTSLRMVNTLQTKEMGKLLKPQFKEYGKSRLGEYLDACASNDAVPEVIWTFWMSEQMSSKRQKSLTEMESVLKVPVILVTAKNLTQFLRWPLHPAFKYLSDIHKSDILRIYFMYHYGGGYTDIKPMVEPWDVYFQEFNDPNVWMVGVPETPNGVAHRPNQPFPADYYKSMISNGFMIARRGNRLLQEVYEMQRQIMDFHAKALEEHPAPEPRCCLQPRDGYPLRWAELMGENMAIVAGKYIGHLARKMKMPDLSDYL